MGEGPVFYRTWSTVRVPAVRGSVFDAAGSFYARCGIQAMLGADGSLYRFQGAVCTDEASSCSLHGSPETCVGEGLCPTVAAASTMISWSSTTRCRGATDSALRVKKK